MQYEIQIGKCFDIEKKINIPKQIIIISKEQLDIIEAFATQKKNPGEETIYILNDCEFTVRLKLEMRQTNLDKILKDKSTSHTELKNKVD